MAFSGTEGSVFGTQHSQIGWALRSFRLFTEETVLSVYRRRVLSTFLQKTIGTDNRLIVLAAVLRVSLSRLFACHLLDEILHLLVMRTLPIDLFAGWADLEFIEIQFGQRLQAVEHSFL